MSCVNLIGSEYTSGRDNLDRKLSLREARCSLLQLSGCKHYPGLNRGCLCTKNDIILCGLSLCRIMSTYIKCILLVLCRMILRNVEKLEVHSIILYFWSVYYFVAHSDKYSLKILQCYLIRMLMTSHHLFSGKSYIDCFSCHLCSKHFLTHSFSFGIHF